MTAARTPIAPPALACSCGWRGYGWNTAKEHVLAVPGPHEVTALPPESQTAPDYVLSSVARRLLYQLEALEAAGEPPSVSKAEQAAGLTVKESRDAQAELVYCGLRVSEGLRG